MLKTDWVCWEAMVAFSCEPTAAED